MQSGAGLAHLLRVRRDLTRCETDSPLPADDRTKPAGEAVGSIKLSKAASPAADAGAPSMVRAADAEIGTEADIGDVGSGPAAGVESALGLQIDDSRPTVARSGGEGPVEPVEPSGSLPLYRFPGASESRHERRHAGGQKPAAKPPSGSRAAMPAAEPATAAGTPVSARKEGLADRLAEHKTLLFVLAALAFAAILVISLMRHMDRSSREADEADRLQKISGQK